MQPYQNTPPRTAAGIGGHLALEFANTVEDHLAQRPGERLTDWARAAAWAGEMGLDGAKHLAAGPDRTLPRLIELREAVFRIGLAIARGEEPARPDLDFLEKAASRPAPDIAPGPPPRWSLTARFADAKLQSLLAREALSLFCGPRAARIRVCEGETCGALFLDESRGKPRRWCSMAACGNRAKARAYARSRKPRKPAEET